MDLKIQILYTYFTYFLINKCTNSKKLTKRYIPTSRLDARKNNLHSVDMSVEKLIGGKHISLTHIFYKNGSFDKCVQIDIPLY